MSFWNVFTSECLQSPWMIRPSKNDSITSNKEISTEFVFFVEEFISDEACSMVSKMILAIGLKPEEVTVLNQFETSLEVLENCTDSKRILCFGKEFPGEMGEKVHWMGHELIKTHSLQTLLKKPQYKKETWVHLKKYGQIK